MAKELWTSLAMESPSEVIMDLEARLVIKVHEDLGLLRLLLGRQTRMAPR